MKSMTTTNKNALLFSLLISSILSTTVVSAASAVKSLDVETYGKETNGKTVFIKFFAPWCGHCKAMAEDWEQLAEEYEDNSSSILIAEVDCTTDEGSELCEDNNVEGFPTLKYGDPLALEDYDGGRDYEELSEFAKENLKPTCSPNNLKLCDDDKKAKIVALQKLSEEELDEELEKVEKLLDANEEWFQKEEDKLQDAYEKLSEEYITKAKVIKKEHDFGLLKSIAAMARVNAEDDEDDGAREEL